MQTEQIPEPLRVREYAEKWKVSESVVRRLIADERLAHVRIGGSIRIMSDTIPDSASVSS